MTFPLGTAPSYYAQVTHPVYAGIWYQSETPYVTLSQATPNAYYITDYRGNTVSSGAVSGTTLTPTAPLGGWKPGWYQGHLTGTNTDAVYGPSYGKWSFVVWRVDARFPTRPAIGTGVGVLSESEAQNWIVRGLMGQTQRFQIADASAPGSGGAFGDNIGRIEGTLPYTNTYYEQPSDLGLDHARPRPLLLQFPNRTYDRIFVNAGGNPLLAVYVKDGTVDGTKVFIAAGPGSSSGTKVQVYYPNNSTLVETYDNLAPNAALTTAINVNGNSGGPSNYIRAFIRFGGTNADTMSPTVIGADYRNGVIQTVAALFPLGITRYEGPLNEGSLSLELIQDARVFHDAVKAGNADAKPVGPCPVDILSLTGTNSWTTVLAGGIGALFDELTTHAYNFNTNGDINYGRYTMGQWRPLVGSYGYALTPWWVTESTNVFIAVYGVDHPQRARVPMLTTIQLEQLGCQNGRNFNWYDFSHGFWSFPSFTLTSAGPTPLIALYRAFEEELFGLAFHHALDFGSNAVNALCLGSLYTSNDDTLVDSKLLLVMQSYVPGATLDLTITGTTDAIDVVDAFGNKTTIAQSGGRITVPIAEIPSYVHLPAGVTAKVYQFLDMGPTPPPSISSLASWSVGSTGAPQIGDDGFMTSYGNSTGVFKSVNALPEAAQGMFLDDAEFQWVFITCGGAWQNLAAFTTFDVDTWDGASWTTQTTVDVSAGCTSFQHGSDSAGMGCKQETYWPEQWVFPVKLPSLVTASGIRLSVSGASFGGEPDAAAIAAGGQGAAAPRITLQEVMVLSNDTPGV